MRLDEIGFGDLKIWQKPEDFCYGVDAVLLGDFASKRLKKSDKRGFDLGTGTGIIPLIMSHKTDSIYIGGLEVQREAYEIAQKNILENECILDVRLEFFQGNVKALPEDVERLSGSMDWVTCNPPYFPKEGAIANNNYSLAVARQEILGELKDFILAGSKLLKSGGKFFMIHRPWRLVDIFQYGRENKLEPRSIRFISDKPMGKPKMILLEMVKDGGKELGVQEPLAVHREDGAYTDEILEIYEKKSK